jgi:hypothetical protein
MKDRNGKQVLFGDGYQCGVVNAEEGGGQIWLMSFLYLHENRTMKPVEIVLKRGAGG